MRLKFELLPFLLLSIFGIIQVQDSFAFKLKRPKRQDSAYEVEGCFSEFKSLMEKDMGKDNSNVRCQDYCREKGFILAGTYNGNTCKCGNIYPTKNKIDDVRCDSRCRSWTPCGTPQTCCGGSNAYTISMVGNIDVAKQVLRRLSDRWQNNEDFRKYMIDLMKENNQGTSFTSLPRKVNDWTSSFDRTGWSTCDENNYMTGLRRSARKGSDEIFRLEGAECSPAAIKVAYPAKMDCYEADWEKDFNKKGWSTCKEGYFMRGLYRSSGHNLYNIEKAACCRPVSSEKHWGSCYNKNVEKEFNSAGTQSCSSNHFMAGMYRSSCEELYCIEEFKCCQMGNFTGGGKSWIENPNLSINIQAVNGNLKSCTMRAMDRTPSSKSYECKDLSERENLLVLSAKSFEIEDKTPLNVAKPEPIPGFRPVVCSAHPQKYDCSKTLETSVTDSTSLTIGAGLEMSVSIGSGIETEASFLGQSVKSTFSMEMSATTSLSVESSKTKEITTTESSTVTVSVPPNKQVMINMLRSVENLIYKWKANFRILGRYSAVWDNDYLLMQDVSTVLSGDSLKIYAFGSWKYPGVDTIKVIVTDQHGGEVLTEGCEHEKGENTEGKEKGRERKKGVKSDKTTDCKLTVSET